MSTPGSKRKGPSSAEEDEDTTNQKPKRTRSKFVVDPLTNKPTSSAAKSAPKSKTSSNGKSASKKALEDKDGDTEMESESSSSSSSSSKDKDKDKDKDTKCKADNAESSVSPSNSRKRDKNGPLTRTQRSANHAALEPVTDFKRSATPISLSVTPITVGSSNATCIGSGQMCQNGFPCQCITSSDYWHLKVDGWHEMVLAQKSPVTIEILDMSGNPSYVKPSRVYWGKLSSLSFLRCPCHSFASIAYTTADTTSSMRPVLCAAIPAQFQTIRLLKTVVHTRRNENKKGKRDYGERAVIKTGTTLELIGEISFERTMVTVLNAFAQQYELATHLPDLSPSLLRLIASYCKC
jgi:hypothetical protein